jgi:NADPH2:quinone reductase
VLRVGELPDPESGPGEVRVRLSYSGINRGDVGKRAGEPTAPMPYPRVIPHNDGAGVIDAIGPGVDPARVGRRVWVYAAQSYRPFGTAAEFTVVPNTHAVDLPDTVSDQVGAALGIPGITAHRALFADGPIGGQTVLVHGVRGAVGSMAAALARWRNATVIGTVRRSPDLARVSPDLARAVVALDRPDVLDQLHVLAPDGIDRIVEVAFSANAHLDATLARQGTTIAAYFSPHGWPTDASFWPLMFANVTIRLQGGDDLSEEARQHAAGDLNAAAAHRALAIPLAPPYPLERIAEAHEAVESGTANGRVLIAI